MFKVGDIVVRKQKNIDEGFWLNMCNKNKLNPNGSFVVIRRDNSLSDDYSNLYIHGMYRPFVSNKFELLPNLEDFI